MDSGVSPVPVVKEVTGEKRKVQEGVPVSEPVPVSAPVPEPVSVPESAPVVLEDVPAPEPVESAPERVAGAVPGTESETERSLCDSPPEAGPVPEGASVPGGRTRVRSGAVKGARGKKENGTKGVRVNIRVSDSVCVTMNRIRGMYLSRGEKDPRYNGVLVMALRCWLKHNDKALYEELKRSGYLD